jgi:hypothetical protein
MVAPPVPATGATTPEPVPAGSHAFPSQPNKVKSTLTLLQANLLVAMLGGFWARRADGHPGPDIMGRGLLALHVLVVWERIRKERARKKPPAKEARRKPG